MIQMFTINGVALDNAALGWDLMAPSLPLSALQHRVTGGERAGRDGVNDSPSTRGPVSYKFVVRTPKANWSTLLALFSTPRLAIRELSDPSRVAYGELLSSTPEQHFPQADIYSHAFIVRIHAGAWRSDEVTSALAAAAPAGVTLPVFAGMSAPVQDAIVRFRGPLEKPQITDTSGAFVVLDGTIPAGQYVRFDLRTGRAWLAATDTWQGGSEISGLVDFGGPRGVFEITPMFPTPSDPTSREGRLTLTQQSYSAGAGFQVRGAAAHLI